jgi:uncharacterized protein (DUF58 family)
VSERESSSGVSGVFGYSISLVLLGLVSIVAAANAAFTLAVFAATVLALMLLVRAWGALGLLRLELSLSCDALRLFPGDSFELRARIVNRKILPAWMRFELTRPQALSPDRAEELVGEAVLFPYEAAVISWKFRADRRGVHRLGPARLVAGDLLGLYRSEKAWPFEHEIVVFPRLSRIGDLELPFRDYFGIRPAKGIIEDPAWYEGTREYSGYKPAKNIHWKASARFGVLQEKIFEPTSHQKIFFLFDGEGFEGAEGSDDFEAALEILGSLAARYAEAGASFAIATDRLVRNFPAVLPLGRGPEHLGRVLELLARCGGEKGQALLPLLGGVGVSGSGFVVIARRPNENTKDYFNLPASRRDRALFVFADDEAGEESLDYPSISFRELRPAAEGGP